MTLIEHLKSDSDVLKLIIVSFAVAVLCVTGVSLLALRFLRRRKSQGKCKEFQRPFIKTKKAKVTPPASRSGSWTPTASFQSFWTPHGFPSFPSKQNPFRITPSSTRSTDSSINTSFESRISPDRTNSSPTFLGQVIACINSSDPRGSPPPLVRASPVSVTPLRRSSPFRNQRNPFILDQRMEEQHLLSLPNSSRLPDSCLLETSLSTPQVSFQEKKLSPTTVDKAVNTDNELEEGRGNTNEPKLKTNVCKEHRKNKSTGIPPRTMGFQGLKLWSHKCQLPCWHELSERRLPYSHVFSSDSSSSSETQQDSDDKCPKEDKFDLENVYFYEEIDQNGRGTLTDKHTSRKAAHACVQTECSGRVSKNYNKGKCKDFFSSSHHNTSTSLQDEAAEVCSCNLKSQSGRKGKLHHQSTKKAGQLTRGDSQESDKEERQENQAALVLLNRTSFIPPKNWYSLGSLCDEDEICQTCGKGNDFNHHHNHHVNSDDSETKLNLSAMDAVSYNDTGYTSTEEEDSVTDSNSKELSTYRLQNGHENGSYDGDYESDSDEIFGGSIIASDDLVFKPLPSISEPYMIQTYASREWKSDTPKAQAMRKGYAAIPSYVSCHQLRQVRGDNYCAIRAALFQALLNGLPVLDKIPEGNISQIPKRLLTSTRGAIEEWSFAGRLAVDRSEVLSTLEEFLAFFVEQVDKSQSFNSKEARTDYLLSVFNDPSGDSEFRLLEAAKVIMFYFAVQLYNDMNSGKDVPVCAWLLFARDSSPDPQALLRNHLNSVGDSGGLEQVEMCLLGYALGVVIQVIRPSQVNQQDFVAYYPLLEDVPTYTPTVTLVAEDDRHYNIVVE